MGNNNANITPMMMPAEWCQQDAILLAWPHAHTDWDYMLDWAQECFKNIATAILSEGERLIIATPEPDAVRAQLAHLNLDLCTFVEMPTNDTWARDFGPIAMANASGNIDLLDFKFNAWGMKFAANHDNQICRSLFQKRVLSSELIDHQDFVLEGGSIESDGIDTILTTSECLLEANRNAHLSQAQIEKELKRRLGAKRVLWLNHGYLAGDDTDSHVDTLARIIAPDTIAYVGCDDATDEHYHALKEMEKELLSLRTTAGEPYKLVKLPMAPIVTDEDGMRLPATYANFLITNQQVLMPTYGNADIDSQALSALQAAFTTRKVTGIDCRALVQQHGSLHCVTMQMPRGTISFL